MNQLLAPSGSSKMMNKAHDCVGTSDHISNSMGNGSEYHEWATFCSHVQQKMNIHQFCSFPESFWQFGAF